jgi:hypothetical protein
LIHLKCFNHKRCLIRNVGRRFFLVSFSSIFPFAILKATFAPSGLYEGYNRLTFDVFRNAPQLIRNSLSFLSYPLLILISISLALILLTAFRFMSLERGISRSLLHVKRPLIILFHGSLLFLAGSIPYVAVGKSSSIISVAEWGQRHTFLLAFPVALILVGIAELFKKMFSLQAAIKLLLMAVPLIAMTILLAQGFAIKLSRATFESGIINSLSQAKAPPAGFVSLITSERVNPRLRFYETNWLMQKAYLQENWYSNINNTSQELPSWLTDVPLNRSYLRKYIMSNFSPKCNTKIYIQNDSISLFDVLKWTIFRIPAQGFNSTFASTCQKS